MSNNNKGTPASPPIQVAAAGNANKADEQPTDEQKTFAAQFLTTEHFTLQTARSATISDSAGRSSLFMSTVSTSLIALSFVGQMTQAGDAFNAFALVLFPTLFFLGLVTFQRVLQSAIADRLFAVEINRIRQFYVEMAPQTKKYFLSGARDKSGSARAGVKISKWQWFLTTAGTIMVINSILLGVFVALVTRALFDPSLIWLVPGGLLTFAVCLTLHYIYQDRMWSDSEKNMSSSVPGDFE